MQLRQPTAEEHCELKRMTRQEIGRVSQRAQIILLVAQGRTYAETGRIFATSNVVVRYWIARFNAEGPVGLFDRFRSGRPRKATPEVVSAIDKIIREDPKEVGQLATFWTVAMMALALVGRLGLKISPSTVRTTFRPAGAKLPPWMGLRFGRPPAGAQREVSR